jgi:hypothetical protein
MKGDSRSEYYNTIFRPKWDKWHKQAEELEKKLEEAVFKSLEKEREATRKLEEAKASVQKPAQAAPVKAAVL